MQKLELSFPAANTDLLRLVEQAKRFMEAAKAPSTRKAYAADISDYRAFCAKLGQPMFGPGGQVLALYVADLARSGKKAATIARRVAAIAIEYRAHGYGETPASSFLVKEVLRGVRRTLGTAQERKSPLLISDIETIVASSSPARLIGLRDKALVLLGFASGCRRAELTVIEVRDLELTSQGLVLTIRRGKTDQQQQGRQVPVALGARPETCPVRACAAWLEAAGIVGGPVFRAVDRHGNRSAQPLDPGSIARILKKAACRAGMNPAETAKIAGHSLRSGTATAAAIAGATEREIAALTGHRSREVRRYIRDANLFRASAAGRLGL
jgi:site-specific recombinase XerD